MSLMMAEHGLESKLRHEITRRTHRRVRNLVVEVGDDGIILRGETNSYHIKQLALHAVRELLPDIPVRNTIQVVGSAISLLCNADDSELLSANKPE
jgi:hypothetical protein